MLESYHMIEADRVVGPNRVNVSDWLNSWLKDKAILRALSHLKKRTGLEPVITKPDGVLLHEAVAVMFAYTVSEPEAFVDLLLEYGKFPVLEGEDRNG